MLRSFVLDWILIYRNWSIALIVFSANQIAEIVACILLGIKPHHTNWIPTGTLYKPASAKRVIYSVEPPFLEPSVFQIPDNSNQKSFRPSAVKRFIFTPDFSNYPISFPLEVREIGIAQYLAASSPKVTHFKRYIGIPALGRKYYHWFCRFNLQWTTAPDCCSVCMHKVIYKSTAANYCTKSSHVLDLELIIIVLTIVIIF